MAVAVEPIGPSLDAPARYASWTPIILGALIATPLSSILLAFGATIGLGVTSAAPTWRDASAALTLLFYLIIQAVMCFGVGGYMRAERERQVWPQTQARSNTVTVFAASRHGSGGCVGDALATLVGSVAITRSNASLPAARTNAAEPLLSYETDWLFRPARRAVNVELAPERAEAGLIPLTSSSHSGMANDDRAYLAQMVAATTGLAGPDAEKRTDTAIANAQTAIARSRRGTVTFYDCHGSSPRRGDRMAAGGRHRDGSPMPRWLGGRI